jgi:hypothetical protein
MYVTCKRYFPLSIIFQNNLLSMMFQYNRTVVKLKWFFFLTNWNDLKRVVPEWLRGLLITKGCLIQLTSVMRLKNTVLFLCTQYTLVLIHHALKKLKCSLFHMLSPKFPTMWVFAYRPFHRHYSSMAVMKLIQQWSKVVHTTFSS